MANSAGGSYLPDGPTINDTVLGTAFRDRTVKTVTVSIIGNQLAGMTGGVQGWQNPESSAILVLRAVMDVTTVSTDAATLDVGLTETSASTTSATLLDGVDVNAAVAVFDSMDASLDSGANAHAQKLPVGKWITIDEITGAAEGMVATLYIQYVVA